MTKTIFEKSQEDHHAYSLPKEAKEWMAFFPSSDLLRKVPLPLPETSELDLTRHFVELSRKNVGIDNVFYPLGSCTMKLNPRINEVGASIPFFKHAHPLIPDEYVQGNLEIIFSLIDFLKELTGMAAGSLLPNAGAQGELVGIKMIAAYHRKQGQTNRKEFLIPDSAHGTNPATVNMAGFEVKSIKTNNEGDIDLNHLQELASERTAGLMLTNPNTLGLFSKNILKIADIVHQAGGLLYYDGANLNAILTLVKPGEMGFDVMHLNLHKTFSTPHGGGGPGSGPVFCNELLSSFLPVPRVVKRKNGYVTIWKDPHSIGKISSFHGNFAIYLRAFIYCMLHGLYGLRKISEMSVLNANYLKKGLSKYLEMPFSQYCMHEFVAKCEAFTSQGIKAIDFAKRMLDYGVHAPTVYFPLIVKEAFLIEPTETESKQTLDRFISIVEKILKEVKEDPELLKMAPYLTPVRRLDEVFAAKTSKLIDSLVANSLGTLS